MRSLRRGGAHRRTPPAQFCRYRSSIRRRVAACLRASSAMSPNVINRPLTPADFAAVSRLHAKVFGPGRFTRTAYRVREGAPKISPYCACRAARRDADRGRALHIDHDRRRQRRAAARPAGGRSRFRRARFRQAASRRGDGGGEGRRRQTRRCWSATSPITAASAFARCPRGRSPCRVRSIRRDCSPPSSSPARSRPTRASSPRSAPDAMLQMTRKAFCA